MKILKGYYTNYINIIILEIRLKVQFDVINHILYQKFSELSWVIFYIPSEIAFVFSQNSTTIS